MAVLRRIQLTEVPAEGGNVGIVRFNDRRIIDAAGIQEMGEELARLVDQEGFKKVLLNFTQVDFLSSAALNQLIKLNQKAKTANGKIRLCGLKPEIKEIFEITRLTKVFEILPDEPSALQGF